MRYIPYPYLRGAMPEIRAGLAAEIESEPVERTEEKGPEYWNGFEDGMNRAADIVRGEGL